MHSIHDSGEEKAANLIHCLIPENRKGHDPIFDKMKKYSNINLTDFEKLRLGQLSSEEYHENLKNHLLEKAKISNIEKSKHNRAS